MPEQRSRARDSQQEQTKRQERAERILDAAAALILRWGYDKTTLDDIARQARVARGTIYLHWKTREELLMALITRERLKVGEEVRQRIQADPAGMTLRGLLKISTLAVMRNPLMRAVLSRNADMLGKLADQGYAQSTFIRSMEDYKQFLQTLRAQGVVATDLDIYAQTYILGAMWFGFFMANTWLPEEFHFSDEMVAELLAEAVQRILAPQQTDSNNTATTASAAIFSQYIDRELQNMQEAYKEQQS